MSFSNLLKDFLIKKPSNYSLLRSASTENRKKKLKNKISILLEEIKKYIENYKQVEDSSDGYFISNVNRLESMSMDKIPGVNKDSDRLEENVEELEETRYNLSNDKNTRVSVLNLLSNIQEIYERTPLLARVLYPLFYSNKKIGIDIKKEIDILIKKIVENNLEEICTEVLHKVKNVRNILYGEKAESEDDSLIIKEEEWIKIEENIGEIQNIFQLLHRYNFLVKIEGRLVEESVKFYLEILSNLKTGENSEKIVPELLDKIKKEETTYNLTEKYEDKSLKSGSIDKKDEIIGFKKLRKVLEIEGNLAYHVDFKNVRNKLENVLVDRYPINEMILDERWVYYELLFRCNLEEVSVNSPLYPKIKIFIATYSFNSIEELLKILKYEREVPIALEKNEEGVKKILLEIDKIIRDEFSSGYKNMYDILEERNSKNSSSEKKVENIPSKKKHDLNFAVSILRQIILLSRTPFQILDTYRYLLLSRLLTCRSLVEYEIRIIKMLSLYEEELTREVYRIDRGDVRKMYNVYYRDLEIQGGKKLEKFQDFFTDKGENIEVSKERVIKEKAQYLSICEIEVNNITVLCSGFQYHLLKTNKFSKENIPVEEIQHVLLLEEFLELEKTNELKNIKKVNIMPEYVILKSKHKKESKGKDMSQEAKIMREMKKYKKQKLSLYNKEIVENLINGGYLSKEGAYITYIP